MDEFRSILESPFLRWRDLLSPQLLKVLPLLRPWLSLDGELRRYFDDPRIRLAMTFQSKYLGMSPFNCPSLFSILSFLEYEYGVYHPIGGCGAVSEAMARAAEEMGATISLDDEVEEILFEGRRAVGVRSRSGVHQADALVINADFARAMTRLVPDHLRRRWTDREDRRQEILVLHLHALPGHRGPVRRPGPPHDLPGQGLPGRTSHDIETRHVLSQDPVVLRAERLRDRSVAGPAGQEHALRPPAGDASASQRRLGQGGAEVPRAGARRSSPRSASMTSSIADPLRAR